MSRRDRGGVKSVNDVARRYREAGYDVVVEPSLDQLPDFLRPFRPDVLAHRGDERVIVEVKSRRELQASSELSELAAAVEQQPGWRLEFVNLGDRHRLRDEPAATTALRPRELDAILEDAWTAVVRGHTVSSLVLAALAAEWLLRKIGKRTLRRGADAGPIALAKTLYSEGPLAQEHYEVLLTLFEARNRALHGGASQDADVAAALGAITELRDLENTRDRIERDLSSEDLATALRQSLVAATWSYDLEHRLSLQTGGWEVYSETLESLEIALPRLGEIEDLSDSTATLSVFADAYVRVVYLIDSDVVSEIEDPAAELVDAEAAQGLAQVATERELELEWRVWLEVTRGEVLEAEVLAAEGRAGAE
jgi:REase_AHJR-like